MTDVEVLLLQRIAEKEAAAKDLYEKLLYKKVDEHRPRESYYQLKKYATPITLTNDIMSKSFDSISQASGVTKIPCWLLQKAMEEDLHVEYNLQLVKIKKKEG